MDLNRHSTYTLKCLKTAGTILAVGAFIFTSNEGRGAFNLGAFYVKAKNLTYTVLGATASTTTGAWLTDKVPASSPLDGGFKTPSDAAVDTGNDAFYVVDTGNSRVQKFTLSTGAFVGEIGKSTGGGTCIVGAQTGWCTGGTFTVGQTDGAFDSPAGIAIDSANSRLYVIDRVRVQKFNLSTGAFIAAIGYSSVTAGTCTTGVQTGWCTGGTFQEETGDGALSAGTRIALDTANDVMLTTETTTARVQKFVLSTGAFSGAIGYSAASGTCAAGGQSGWCTGGNFSYSFSSKPGADGTFRIPTAIALDLVNGNFYVADAGTHTVQRFNASTGAMTGVLGLIISNGGTCTYGVTNGFCLGGTFGYGLQNGEFWGATAVAVDAANDLLYVSDTSGQRIQKFNLAGAFAGAIGYSSGGGTCSTGVQTGWCTGGTYNLSFNNQDGGFNTPTSIVLTATGLYVVDSNNNRVQKINRSTGAPLGSITAIATPLGGWASFTLPTTALGQDGGVSSPGSISVDEVNSLFYVADSNRISKFNLSTGAFIGAIGRSTASGTCISGKQNGWCTGGTFSSGSNDGMFNGVHHLAIDVGNDALYAAGNNRIQKFTLSTGAFVGAIGKSTAAGTCVAGKQNGWCTGGTFSSGTGDGQLGSNTFIAVSPTQGIFVSDTSRIQKFNLSGAFAGAIGKSTAAGTCVAGSQSGWCTGGTFSSGAGDGMLNNAGDIAATATHIYIIDRMNYRIQRFLVSGAYSGTIGKSTAAGTCRAGRQLTWCTGGTFSTGPDDGAFAYASSIALNVPMNQIVIGENKRIQKFNLTTGAFVGAIGYLLAPSGNCRSGIQLQWCTGGSGFAGDSGLSNFVAPDSLAIWPGRLMIVDSTNHRIELLSQ